MITFVQLIFEFVVYQVLINAIKGISFIFFLKKKKRKKKEGDIINRGPWWHFSSVRPSMD